MRASDLLDAGFVLDLLEANLGRIRLDGERLGACRIVPLKVSKTGGKSVVEFRVIVERGEGSAPEQRSVVAVWRPDGANAEVFGLLRRLWSAGFDGSGPDAVCEPIAYLDDCNLMLINKVDGSELERVLATGGDGVAAAVEAAARWLAKLHAAPVRGTRVRAYAEERALLGTWLTDLSEAYPDYRARLVSVEGALLEAERRVHRGLFCLTHGDFHPENIFVGGGRVTVTDFERSCVFDPAADLGFFLCQLAAKARMGRYGVTPDEVRRLRSRFLSAYGAASGGAVEGRVGAFEARGFLEVAHYVFCLMHVPPDRATFEFYLDNAEARVAEVA